MKKNKNKDKNFLEFVPIKSEKIDWVSDNKGLVKLTVLKNGIFDKLVRKLFKTPNKATVDLDEQGSNVWQNIDGNRNVYDLSQLQKEKFGKKAEPTIDRLIKYVNILNNNAFITLKKK